MDIITVCTSCVFFEDHVVNDGKTKKDDGLCRYNPPVSQPGPSTHGLWPVVSAKDWCGHFTAQRGHISGVAA
jgi:hypothetical protein